MTATHPTTARPALIADVMQVLQRRRHHELPLVQYMLEQRLGDATIGVLDVLRACKERGLVNLSSGKGHRMSAEARLTPAGHAWAEPEDGPPEPQRYAWLEDEVMTAGTLADYARAWEHAHYSGDPSLTHTLRTWHHPGGYLIRVDETSRDDDWITYRIWVAGEQVFVTIDGRN